MEEWKKYKAIDFCENVTDGTHDSPKRQDQGYYLITSKHLKEYEIDFSSAYRISRKDYLSIIQRSAVEQYDILFSMIGTIGNVVRVEIDPVDFAVKNIGIFKMGRNALKSKWMYYWLKSPKAKEYICSRLAGSTQSYLTLNSLREFPIQAPNEKKMKSIVDVLSSLDDKIALNRRINDNLEQQAQALFKSWFVDFEPFQDGEFVESELGRIPKGWKVCELGEVTIEVKEKVKDRHDVKVLSPVTTGKLVLSEEYFTKQVYSASTSKYILVKPLSFAYNPARVNIGSLGMNEFSFDGCVSPVYVVFQTEPDYQFFFDLYRTTQRFQDEVVARSIGGVRQTLGYKDFSLIKLIYPPKDVVKNFNKIYLSLKQVISSNNKENERTSNLRDTLLPRLMSGELKINELDN